MARPLLKQYLAKCVVKQAGERQATSKSPPALPLADSLSKPEALSSDSPSVKWHPCVFPSSLSSPDPVDHGMP